MRHVVTLPLLLVVAVTACGEGMHSDTACQYESPDHNWIAYGFHVAVESPSPIHCPLGVTYFGMPMDLAADVSAPVGVPEGIFTWQVRDAIGIAAGGGVDFFGPVSGGRILAQPSGQYYAGNAGDMSMRNRPQQDALVLDIPLAGVLESSFNIVYLPYTRTTQLSIASTGLPRAKKGRQTVVRVMPSAIPGNPAPIIKWYRNGVQFTPPSNPWSVGGMNGTAYVFAPYTTGYIDWTTKIGYGFPTQWKTTGWRQYVDP